MLWCQIDAQHEQKRPRHKGQLFPNSYIAISIVLSHHFIVVSFLPISDHLFIWQLIAEAVLMIALEVTYAFLWYTSPLLLNYRQSPLFSYHTPTTTWAYHRLLAPPSFPQAACLSIIISQVVVLLFAVLDRLRFHFAGVGGVGHLELDLHAWTVPCR